MTLSTILLSGGTGLRLGAPIPKQYLTLNGKEIVRYSFEELLPFGEMVVVSAPEFRHFFEGNQVKFAEPGLRRQDSVYNGLQQCTGDWIIIHDAARPFIKSFDVEKLIEEAQIYGAACLATPLKYTLKEADNHGMVVKTPDRSRYWEIQTPQVIKRDILEAGFIKAHEENLSVTDDVSLAELMGYPVKLVLGSDNNIKITTQEDLSWARWKMSE